jgi:hypothetical protein
VLTPETEEVIGRRRQSSVRADGIRGANATHGSPEIEHSLSGMSERRLGGWGRMNTRWACLAVDGLSAV